MNISSDVFEHQPAMHSVSLVPSPLRYTQMMMGVTALACAVIQLIHGEAGDLYIGASLLGIAMTYYALRWHVLAFSPLSALALVGCGLSNFFLPLVLTTVEGKPVTFELQRPDLTFGFNLFAFAVLIAVHFVYLRNSRLQEIRFTISLRLWRPLGIFVVPSPPQLFALGAVGMGSMAFIYFALGLTTGETFGSVGLKTIEGLFWLAYAPYLLLLYPLLGFDSKPARSSVVPLLVYSTAMLIVGSATNSRTAIVFGAAGVLIGVVLAGWLGLVPAKLFRPRNMLLASLAAAAALPLINHFGASMLVARGDRHQVSPIEVVISTFGALVSGESVMALAEYQSESDGVAKWHGGDEYYLDSMLFGRLCNLKFADNTLLIVAGLDRSGRSSIADREWERALSILPQPILTLFGLGLDKEAHRGSMGSFIYYLSSGRPELLDQFATGSYLASGWATFGWLFPCIIGVIGLVLFVGLDSFATPAHLSGRASIAPVTAMGLFGIFTLFTSAAGAPESVAGLVEVIVREIPQQTLTYVLAFWCVRQVFVR